MAPKYIWKYEKLEENKKRHINKHTSAVVLGDEETKRNAFEKWKREEWEAAYQQLQFRSSMSYLSVHNATVYN